MKNFLNITNNKKIIVNSLKEISKEIGVNVNTVRTDLNLGNKFIYNDKYIFFLKDKEEEIKLKDFVKKKSASEKILVENIETGEIKKFNSIRETYRIMKLTRNTIKYRLNSGKPINGYLFRRDS